MSLYQKPTNSLERMQPLCCNTLSVLWHSTGQRQCHMPFFSPIFSWSLEAICFPVCLYSLKARAAILRAVPLKNVLWHHFPQVSVDKVTLFTCKKDCPVVSFSLAIPTAVSQYKRAPDIFPEGLAQADQVPAA